MKYVLDISAPKAAVEIAAIYSGTVGNKMAEARDKFGVKFHTLSAKDQLKAVSVSLPIWEKIAGLTRESKQAVEAIEETLRYLSRMPEQYIFPSLLAHGFCPTEPLFPCTAFPYRSVSCFTFYGASTYNVDAPEGEYYAKRNHFDQG